MLNAELMTKDNDDDDFGDFPMESQGARTGPRNEGEDQDEEGEEDDDDDDDEDDDDDALKRMGLSKEERYVKTYVSRNCSASLANLKDINPMQEAPDENARAGTRTGADPQDSS